MRVKTTLTMIVVATLIMASPSLGQDWAGKGRAQGLVTDPQGNPIEGASVTLRPVGGTEGPEPLQTSKKGRWSILGLDGGDWVVTVEADGYQTAEGPYRVNPFNASPALNTSLVASPFSSITVGDELLQSGDHAGARAEYEKAIPHLDAEPAAALRSRIGDTYMGEGNYAGARAAYTQALEYLDPAQQAHPRLKMADSYMAEGNLDEARRQYEGLLSVMAPADQAPVHLQIARTYGQQDRTDEAIVALQNAIEVSPGNVPVLQLLADLLGRAGRDEEAQAYLELLPADAKLPPDMLLNTGIQKYNAGDLENAMSYFNRAVEENPEMADTYYYRGLVHLNNGSNPEAAADFKKLIELAEGTDHAAEAVEFLKYLEPGG